MISILYIMIFVSAIIVLSPEDVSSQLLPVTSSNSFIMGARYLPLFYVLMKCCKVFCWKILNESFLLSILDSIVAPNSGIEPLKLFTILLLSIDTYLPFLPYLLPKCIFQGFEFVIVLCCWSLTYVFIYFLRVCFILLDL